MTTLYETLRALPILHRKALDAVLEPYESTATLHALRHGEHADAIRAVAEEILPAGGPRRRVTESVREGVYVGAAAVLSASLTAPDDLGVLLGVGTVAGAVARYLITDSPAEQLRYVQRRVKKS